jgi:hypothetical protein
VNKLYLRRKIKNDESFLLAISFFFSLVSLAGDGVYNVSLIPEALFKNAGAVKRMEVIEFEISESTVQHYDIK